MDKTTIGAFIFIAIVSLTAILRAGTTSSNGTQFKSAVDLCIDEGLKDINIESTEIFVPRIFNTYGSASLVDGFSFYSTKDEKVTDIQGVEERMVKTVTKLLHMVNSLPSIRPYLLRFPMTVEDIAYELQFRNKQTDNHYYEPAIAVGYFNRYELELEVFHNPHLANPLPIKPDLVGRKKIKCTSIAEIPELNKLRSVTVPRGSLPCKEITYIKNLSQGVYGSATREFAQYFGKYTKKRGLKIASLRNAAEPRKSETYRPIAPGMWSYDKINLQAAIELGRTTFIDFYKWTTTNPEMVASEEYNHKIGYCYYEGTDAICFRITFWDEYFNRVEEPYIAQILCQDSMIEYYTADEGQRLVKVFEEPVPSIENR